jgi:hypothetical protein
VQIPNSSLMSSEIMKPRVRGDGEAVAVDDPTEGRAAAGAAATGACGDRGDKLLREGTWQRAV